MIPAADTGYGNKKFFGSKEAAVSKTSVSSPAASFLFIRKKTVLAPYPLFPGSLLKLMAIRFQRFISAMTNVRSTSSFSVKCALAAS